MKRIIPINKEPGYEWDVYGDGTYILVLQNDLKSWLPKPTFDTQFFKVQDNVIIPKSETLKTSIKSNIEIDTELGAEDEFLNKKGEFTQVSILVPSHKDTTDKNAEPNFQHVTQEEKDLISSTATTVNGHTEDISNLETSKADKATTLSGYGIIDAYTKAEIDNKVSAVYKFKGNVNTYADLPATNQVVGDVYNVNATGINYAWDGAEWDNIGGVEPLATSTNNGLMSKEDFSKLAGIEAGAEVNNISDLNVTDLTDGGDTNLHYHSADRNRANHTGTQPASTISDFDTEVANNTTVSANTSARHTHNNKTVLDNTTASFTVAYQNKLDGIQEGAEANVNADWNASSGDAQILNKPTSMPSSDVYAWAKAPTKPTYNASEIGGLGANYRWLTDTYITTWDAKEPAIVKLTAFNKNFGTTAGTVSEGNHTHTFASLTSKPNTLSGYAITDAYTKTEIDAKIAAVFIYKGSIPTYVDLTALTGMTVGDVYNVTETGDNYAWTGTEWDKLSGEIDLSAYLTIADASNTYETKVNVNLLTNIVSGHTEDISNLETDKANKATTLSGYAITDAYTKTEIDTNFENHKTYSNVTYDDLITLISNNELVPNSSYRITDYTTTTAQDDTTSAGHDFDIIVTALSTNELSEIASCVRKSDDTYFANANLEAWEIKYCINNDTSRFAWADAVNGKGVIYYMKDEWGNECPYDFKNIQFKRYPILSMPNGSTALVFDANNQKTKYAVKDADGAIVPNGAVIDENNASYYFTFNAILQGSETYDVYDASVIQKGIKNSEGGDFIVQNNKINEAHTTFNKPYKYGQILKLNNIVINNIVNSLVYTVLSKGCHSNTFDNDCYYITFGDNCYSNSFGIKCDSNTFGNGCYYNIFGDGFDDNTFGNDCYSNIFGDKCDTNTFGNNCYFNKFANNCDDNTFGNSCSSNTFGDYCKNNTFGDSYYFNSFGNYCSSNTFGDNCSSNTFGNNCYHNTFGSSCNDNSFDNKCTNNTFDALCTNNRFGNYCSNNTFMSNCKNNRFGNYCSNNKFGNVCEVNTFGTNCYDNTFGTECQGNTFGNNCQTNLFNYDCSNNIFGNSCNNNIFGDYCKINLFGDFCYNNTFGNSCESNTFGNACKYNNFYAGTSGTTKKDFIAYIVLESGCRNNNFYSDVTTSSSSFLQRIRIKGLENTTATNTQITLSATNTNYEWLICYTSTGVLKQYCPND